VFVLWGSHERWYEGVASLTSSTQRSVHFLPRSPIGVTVNHANHSKVLRVILEHSEGGGCPQDYRSARIRTARGAAFNVLPNLVESWRNTASDRRGCS
jgi:hypothetical protein